MELSTLVASSWRFLRTRSIACLTAVRSSGDVAVVGAVANGAEARGGTLGFAETAEIYDRIGGTFTWLPAVGAVVGRGGTLFKVNNLPIALMYGSVPAYRALKEGVTDGPDIGELNANLVALGYDPYRAVSVNDHFSEATAAAVKRWQHAEGLTETGEVELGRIVFAPGARRVTSVHVVIGQDPPGAESGSSEPSGSSTPSGSSAPS